MPGRNAGRGEAEIIRNGSGPESLLVHLTIFIIEQSVNVWIIRGHMRP